MLDCRIDMQVSFGKYVWCGNPTIPHGFVLTNQNINDLYGDLNTFVLNIEINMNRELLNETEYIEIYTPAGGLFGYNVYPIRSSIYNFFKKIKQSDIGVEMKILFRKAKVLTDEEEKILKKSFVMRRPMDTIFEQYFTIPDILSFNDRNECNICLSDVEDLNNTYISPCGHKFHMSCIWQYLTLNNLITNVNPRCSEMGQNGNHSCCNTGRIIVSKFKCPTCRTDIKITYT